MNLLEIFSNLAQVIIAGLGLWFAWIIHKKDSKDKNKEDVREVYYLFADGVDISVLKTYLLLISNKDNSYFNPESMEDSINFLNEYNSKIEKVIKAKDLALLYGYNDIGSYIQEAMDIIVKIQKKGNFSDLASIDNDPDIAALKLKKNNLSVFQKYF